MTNTCSENGTVLIIAAHPDDELLGVGGAAMKHLADGCEVYALILGEGMKSRDPGAQESLSRLQETARKAASIIGFTDIFFEQFPDNEFDTVSLLSITKVVESYLSRLKPSLVYTHHGYDVNIDHQRTFQAVVTAARPCNDEGPCEIRTFETLSSTEWQVKDHQQFSPNLYIDIEPYLSKKIEAMQAYETEIRDYPHSRSSKGIEVLSGKRGIEAGVAHAEAFFIVRKIIK